MPLPSERGSTLGPAFDAWFRRACDREASKRFASADEQVEALAVALGLPVQPRLSDPMSAPAIVQSSDPGGSAATFNASSSDVKAGRKRISRRRWLAGGIVGAVGALGIAATIARIASDSEGKAVRALGSDTGIPSVHASAGPDPSSAAPIASPALSAGLAIDAAAPASSSGPPPVIPKAAGSAAKHRGGPSAGTPPASPGSDTVWGER
jgi:serine/threonine-protein kinase